MTKCTSGTTTGLKRVNMVAILKFKLAAKDTRKKKWNQFEAT